MKTIEKMVFAKTDNQYATIEVHTLEDNSRGINHEYAQRLSGLASVKYDRLTPQDAFRAVLMVQRTLERKARLVRIEMQFRKLANVLYSDATHLSRVDKIVIRPEYQQVIGLGPDVIPVILKEITKRPYHWFWALRMLTRVKTDPVKKENRGNVKKMAEDWLEWARLRGEGRLVEE